MNKTSLLKKFNNYWFRSAFFTVMQRLSVVLFGVVSYIILVRILTPSQIGTWALFLAISATFEMSKNALLKNGVVAIINSTNVLKEKCSIASSSLLINIGFTFLFILLIFAGAHPLSIYWKVPSLESMMHLYCITIIVFIPFSHLEYMQQANMSFKGIFASYFTKQGIFFLLIIISASWFQKFLTLDALVLFQIAGTVIASVVSFLYARKFLTLTFNPTAKWYRALIGYGKYAFGSGTLSCIFGSMDRYMTASLLNSIDVAYYDVSARINNVIDVPATAAADIIFPKSARASFEEGTKKVKYLYERMAGILVGLVLPVSIFVFIFAEWVIRIIAGEKYLAAAGIIRVAMIYAVLRPAQNQGSNILNSINKPNVTFYLNLMIFVVNLVLNYVFIKIFGLMGAAYGTLLSTVFSFIVTYYFLHKIVAVTLPGVVKYTIQFYKDIFEKTVQVFQRFYVIKKEV